ncbi:cobalt-precorrin-6A reductase [Sedimentitalea sp. XS_ASV28]|uniref:cobalt-precorrin-6A reductase n=1 Tax=Sedimentitalea sp. XS_ASV28 TaxID=3241296 RepID=UPI00351286C6
MANVSGQHRHILLLAGAGEARAIAAALAERDDCKVTGSFLYPPRSFGPLPVPTRYGRFGGEDGMARYLMAEGIDAVIDATHPFAHQISASAARVCARLAIPLLQVLRPCWTPGAGDRWTEVADERAVAAHLRPGQRVFTTTGRATLDHLVSRCDARFFVRQLEERRPPENLKNVRYVTGNGPFSVEEERDTLSGLEIDVLVVKNSGGTTSETKLIAARSLGLPVILIARPPQPDVPRVETVSGALNWVDGL